MKINQAIAIAVCTTVLGEPSAGQIWVQITPAGHFTPTTKDPRAGNEHWFIDAASAKNVIDLFSSRQTETVIDYEHQTLYKEANGQPAPAAAWFKKLEWREGQGLFGLAELTNKAEQAITAKEYRYFSPVFIHEKETGVITDLLMGAFTNYPAIDGLQELVKLAAETFLPHQTPEENTMDLKKLLEALGLAENASQEDILAAIKALQEAKENKAEEAVAAATAKISKALGIDEKTSADDLIAACSALTIAAKAKKTDVDPKQYVPMSAFLDLQNSVAALTAQTTGDKVEQLIEKATAEGKLLPTLTDWARDLGKKDMVALTAFIEKSPSIAALTCTQTKGQQPDPHNFNLTKTELEVAALTGFTPKEFADAKKVQEQN